MREDLGYSQDRVAKDLGLGRASISNIEAGKHKVPLSTLYELSGILKKEIHLILPTLNEIKERQNDDESEITSLLKKEQLTKQLRTDIEKIIKNL